MIKVFGAKGIIQDIDYFLKQILNLSEEHEIIIQAVDADLIYGKNHLISAAKHALRSFERGDNSTNTLVMEILLYAAGERQIQRALQKLGVKKGKVSIAFVITKKSISMKTEDISDTIIEKILEIFNLLRDDTVLEGDVNTLKKFGVTHKELSTIPEWLYGDILLEKVAMVDIIK